jgi:hypothetical protein
MALSIGAAHVGFSCQVFCLFKTNPTCDWPIKSASWRLNVGNVRFSQQKRAGEKSEFYSQAPFRGNDLAKSFLILDLNDS